MCLLCQPTWADRLAERFVASANSQAIDHWRRLRLLALVYKLMKLKMDENRLACRGPAATCSSIWRAQLRVLILVYVHRRHSEHAETPEKRHRAHNNLGANRGVADRASGRPILHRWPVSGVGRTAKAALVDCRPLANAQQPPRALLTCPLSHEGVVATYLLQWDARSCCGYMAAPGAQRGGRPHGAAPAACAGEQRPRWTAAELQDVGSHSELHRGHPAGGVGLWGDPYTACRGRPGAAFCFSTDALRKSCGERRALRRESVCSGSPASAGWRCVLWPLSCPSLCTGPATIVVTCRHNNLVYITAASRPKRESRGGCVGHQR